jgi:DNA repair protein RadC
MAESKDTPHYTGHRQRLRQRFVATDGEGMPDYEMLELLLSQAIPRADVKPVAKALLARFGSLGEVVSAPLEALQTVKGVGEAAAVALKVVRAVSLRLAHQQVQNTNVIGSWNSLIDYCKAAMGYEKIEQLRVLYLDGKNVLIADEVQQRGTIDHTPIYPRQVLKRALELNASALILVHNHPSGDPTPSKQDIDLTKEVRESAEKLGISLHDHVIIGKSAHISFKSMSLL